MMHRHQAALPYVRDQDADYAEREVKVGGEIGHRDREPAPAQHGEMLGLKALMVGMGTANRDDHGNQVEAFTSRPGPAAGERIGADHRAGVLVKPSVLARGHLTSRRL